MTSASMKAGGTWSATTTRARTWCCGLRRSAPWRGRALGRRRGLSLAADSARGPGDDRARRGSPAGGDRPRPRVRQTFLDGAAAAVLGRAAAPAPDLPLALLHGPSGVPVPACRRVAPGPVERRVCPGADAPGRAAGGSARPRGGWRGDRLPSRPSPGPVRGARAGALPGAVRNGRARRARFGCAAAAGLGGVRDGLDARGAPAAG